MDTKKRVFQGEGVRETGCAVSWYGVLIYGCSSKIGELVWEWGLSKRLGRKLVAKKVFRIDGEPVTFLSR